MAQHLAAFRATQQSTPIVQLNSITEQVTRRNGNGYIVPSGFNMIAWLYANGANISRARLQSPSILRRMPVGVEIAPLDIAAVPTSPQGTVMDLLQNPILLDEQEELDAYVANANNSEYETILVSFMNGNTKLGYILGGKWYDISGLPKLAFRATGTQTLTTNTWTLCAMTYSSIPSGKYAIIGMKAISATALAGRLVIPGYNWRPGVVGSVLESSQDYSKFRDGHSMGVLGIFDHLNPPNLEMLATTADTAETLYLDCVKIA